MDKCIDILYFKLPSYQGNLVWRTLELFGFDLYRADLNIDCFFLF
ncbi:hypothetical protein SCAZ3_07710 [Streptococcus canis FSL Z3-227]|uniref:Uncharacterized protein n=1 Tax=Streptococcus canis FSL Z3-227 TaxID=482234 RepID=A0AAV3FTI0_STRCB|nr:hypothetical protein SCAZ3_07710 [Streptococcus canis FSL Z3-227]